MESGLDFDDAGCGGTGDVSGSPTNAATFHFANEKGDGNNVKPVRKQGTTARRRRNVSKTSIEDTAPRDDFEQIKQKLSVIDGPDRNNNRSSGGYFNLYSTPLNLKKKMEEKYFTPGASPNEDSGFKDGSSVASPSSVSGLKHALSTPIKDMFTSPNEKYFEEKKTSHTFSTSHTTFSTKKRRLFESSKKEYAIFGMTFKLDEVIPVLVLAFVAISAIVTVTTLTSALRRAHGVTRPAPNGKYQSIQFAYDQLNSAGDDKFQVLDEEGNVLGGKRAAIQFAYDLKEEDSPHPGNDVGQGHFDNLELLKQIEEMTAKDDQQIAVEAAEPLGEIKPHNSLSREEKKERLIRHINSFGHFATSQVANLRKKRAAAKKSKNNHPFKAYSDNNGQKTKTKNGQEPVDGK